MAGGQRLPGLRRAPGAPVVGRPAALPDGKGRQRRVERHERARQLPRPPARQRPHDRREPGIHPRGNAQRLRAQYVPGRL